MWLIRMQCWKWWNRINICKRYYVIFDFILLYFQVLNHSLKTWRGSVCEAKSMPSCFGHSKALLPAVGPPGLKRPTKAREEREERARDKCIQRVKSVVGTQHPHTRTTVVVVLNEGKNYSTVYISPGLFVTRGYFPKGEQMRLAMLYRLDKFFVL